MVWLFNVEIQLVKLAKGKLPLWIEQTGNTILKVERLHLFWPELSFVQSQVWDCIYAWVCVACQEWAKLHIIYCPKIIKTQLLFLFFLFIWAEKTARLVSFYIRSRSDDWSRRRCSSEPESNRGPLTHESHALTAVLPTPRWGDSETASKTKIFSNVALNYHLWDNYCWLSLWHFKFPSLVIKARSPIEIMISRINLFETATSCCSINFFSMLKLRLACCSKLFKVRKLIQN